MLVITDSTPADIEDLAARICEEDRAELAASGMDTSCLDGFPSQALRLGDKLVCLFGVSQMPNDSGAGIPWMLCTETINTVPRMEMAKVSASVVDGWRQQYKALSNLIHRRNARAIRFVRWLGFTVHALPQGPGQEFFLFDWSLPPCATQR